MLYMTVLVKQEFMEIPVYGAVEHPIFAFLRKPAIKGMLIGAPDLYFSGHGECHSIARRAKRLYLFLCAWLLTSKIIGGETDNHQVVPALFI